MAVDGKRRGDRPQTLQGSARPGGAGGVASGRRLRDRGEAQACDPGR